MSSTYQFDSGLNDWIDTDKPTRADFVRDNSILTEKAMWAEDYDPTGEVGVVGIAEYMNNKFSDSGWLPISPLNGTTELRALSYRKIGNVVYLKGAFGNVTSSGNPIAILPSGFRPSGVLRSFVAPTSFNAATTSSLQINTVGSIIVNVSGGNTLDVSSISFAT